MASGVPAHVSKRARRFIDLLISALDVNDVRIVGKIWRWPKMSARLGLQIEKKWFVTFEWGPDFGVKEIEVERH
jgi:hypothetical protein